MNDDKYIMWYFIVLLAVILALGIAVEFKTNKITRMTIELEQLKVQHAIDLIQKDVECNKLLTKSL